LLGGVGHRSRNEVDVPSARAAALPINAAPATSAAAKKVEPHLIPILPFLGPIELNA
jgi:hypothetical protein